MPDTAFSNAIETVLAHEGGFVDHPDDPGGATNWGVSLRWLVSLGDIDLDRDGFTDFDFDRDGDVDADDIRKMTREDAVEVYRIYWWERFEYNLLPELIGPKTFDLAVNMGAHQAHKLLQRACRACDAPVVDDGVLGPVTRKAVFCADERALLTSLRSEAAGFYRGLVIAKPRFETFIAGWLRRAYA